MGKSADRENLEQEMEQLRTALEAAQDEICQMVEERGILNEKLLVQARELRALSASHQLVQKDIHASEIDKLERQRMIQTQEQLRVSLEEMQVLVEELEDTNEGIRRMNARLEDRVAQRTREIEASRAQLAASEQRFRTLIESVP